MKNHCTENQVFQLFIKKEKIQGDLPNILSILKYKQM
jgi:hypothetical protein